MNLNKNTLLIITLICLFYVKAGFAQTDSNFQQTDETFVVVEQMPEYPGGEEARINFLTKNIKYPDKEFKNKVQGLVIVSFVVEKDGSLSNINVLKGVSPALDAEAVRVVGLMKKWTPGYLRGQPVRVQINLPIRFSLN